jgi:hypothetical protein
VSTSRNSGHSRGTELLDGLPALSRYDALLAAITAVFVLALAAHAAGAVPLRTAVTAGALCSALLLADALYVNPPAPAGDDASED